jgi:hypothetical protein
MRPEYAPKTKRHSHCTYRPQKRCSGADFARWPILVRGSCNVIVGFVIPRASLVLGVPPAGPLCSTGITPRRRYYEPIRQALTPSMRFVSRLACLPCFRGFSPRGQRPSLFPSMALHTCHRPLPRREMPTADRFRWGDDVAALAASADRGLFLVRRAGRRVVVTEFGLESRSV